MAFIFLDEIAVEPLAFVGIDADIQISVPDIIHRLYSTAKYAAVNTYNCGRYLQTKKDPRFLHVKSDNRIIQTKKGNCK